MKGAIFVLAVLLLANAIGAVVLLVIGHIGLSLGFAQWMALVFGMSIAVVIAIWFLLWLIRKTNNADRIFRS